MHFKWCSLLVSVLYSLCAAVKMSHSSPGHMHLSSLFYSLFGRQVSSRLAPSRKRVFNDFCTPDCEQKGCWIARCQNYAQGATVVAQSCSFNLCLVSLSAHKTLLCECVSRCCRGCTAFSILIWTTNQVLERSKFNPVLRKKRREKWRYLNMCPKSLMNNLGRVGGKCCPSCFLLKMSV